MIAGISLDIGSSILWVIGALVVLLFVAGIALFFLAVLAIPIFAIWLVIRALTDKPPVNTPVRQIQTVFGEQPVMLDQDGLVLAQSFQQLSQRMGSANQEAWNQVAAQIFGGDPGSDNPLGVILRVRAALVAGDLESVRDSISDALYNRWRLRPQSPPTSYMYTIALTVAQTNEVDGSLMVTVGQGLSMTGAVAENWHMVRVPIPVTAVGATASGTCPRCGAPFEAGETNCRYCGAALATPVEIQADPDSGRWIVDDVDTASAVAA